MVYVVFFPPDFVDAREGHNLLIWEDGVLTHQQVIEIAANKDGGMALSPDATTLVIPELEALRLHSVPDGAVLRSAKHFYDIF